MGGAVTEATGVLGSTLVDRLLREGQRVLAVDDLSSGHSVNLADSAHDPQLAAVGLKEGLARTVAWL